MFGKTPEPLSWVVIQLNFKEGQVVDMLGTQGRGEDRGSVNKNLNPLGGSVEGRQRAFCSFALKQCQNVCVWHSISSFYSEWLC